MTDKVVNTQLFAITAALIVGVLIGVFVIKPILKKISRIALRRRRPYISHLFKTLSKISPVFGAVLLLNALYFLPIDISLKGNFRTILRVLDAIIFTFLLTEVLIFVYDKYSNRKVDNKVSSLLHIIIRLLVYSVGILIISSILDYDIKAMLTALGVGGLAVALALQDTLSNLFSGMQILASRQLRPGDYVKIEEGVEGYVLDINWRNTTLVTLFENVIIVPNSKISATITTNYFALQKNLYFQVDVGVHYDSDLEFVEKVTLEVAEEVLSKYPNVPKNFRPRVRFYEFADSSINFKVWMATDLYENQFLIRHHFIKALQDRYNREGIVIPFPIRTLYVQKEV